MRRSDFRVGQRWALRRTRQLGEPATAVELVLWVDVKPSKSRSATSTASSPARRSSCRPPI